ncbi:hypothetical protein ACFY1A_45510 [Streptomyces sp. NPDC001520]|uniref:hypothetical protein n=1 Tax=Streptomyces sp. NPDC001520 TaxID=3364581 RepID=UPI0036A08282
MVAGMTGAWIDHDLAALRAACYAADDRSLVALLRTRDAEPVLQQCGDVLTAAITRGVPAAVETAARCSAALHMRNGEGDEVLADQLDAAIGGTAPFLRPLPVDLEELSGLLEGDPAWGGGWVDLNTGECLPATADSGDLWYGVAPEDTGQRLHVACAGSHAAYRDMEDFIAVLDDRSLADALATAIRGRGAFRRFKDVLAASPAEQRRYWLFSAERRHGRARAWLADHDYRPTPHAGCSRALSTPCTPGPS